jgi:hypothetical protein
VAVNILRNDVEIANTMVGTQLASQPFIYKGEPIFSSLDARMNFQLVEEGRTGPDIDIKRRRMETSVLLIKV